MTSFNTVKRTGQLLLALLLSAATLEAMAANVDAAAKVLFSHGTVTVTNAEVGHDLKKGDPVAAGDTIRTGQDGRIQLRFTDGGLVSLRPNSTFAVNSYTQPDAKGNGALEFNLIKGGLRSLSGTIGHKNHDNYKLKTGVATLGIRGTQFLVTVNGKVMRVHVGHGGVSLYNDHGTLLLSAGQNGQVSAGQPPALSLVAPQFDETGESGDDTGASGNGDDSGSSGGGSGSTQGGSIGSGASAGAGGAGTPPDTNLNQTLPDDILTGGNGPNLHSSFAFSQVTFDITANTNPPPASYAITTAGFAGFVDGHSSGGSGGNELDPNDLSGIQNEPPGTNVTGKLLWGVPNPDDPNQLFAYAIGSPTQNMPMSATLHYSLNKGFVRTRYSSGNADALDHFDMVVTLNGTANPTFKVTGMGTSQGSDFHMDTAVIGHWTNAGNGRAAFEFKNAQSGTSSGCQPCSLDAAGFFSGDKGAQAAVTFTKYDSDNTAHVGAAALDKDIVN